VSWLHGGLAGADLAALFGHFLVLSLLAVGGALSTAPEMQRWIVGERGWLSAEDFASSVALAQAAPGPNVLFVAVVGFNVAGLAGVAAAMAGTLLPSSVLAITAQRSSQRHERSLAVRAFNAGLAPLTLGLLLATGWLVIEPGLLRPAAGGGVAQGVAVALVAGTLWLALRTGWPPLVPIVIGAAAGAVLGAAGWL
jgi:chromate transporter